LVPFLGRTLGGLLARF
uniref:Temporin-1Ts n=1 Tax=Rana temporaria TaxID=8407 RepID=TPS_RANTE|nr:RecName: Full=Temporin-1Ts; AltName: Full=Temporin-S [Rana temporaria]